jgi:hypothetical protein
LHLQLVLRLFGREMETAEDEGLGGWLFLLQASAAEAEGSKDKGLRPEQQSLLLQLIQIVLHHLAVLLFGLLGGPFASVGEEGFGVVGHPCVELPLHRVHQLRKYLKQSGFLIGAESL